MSRIIRSRVEDIKEVSMKPKAEAQQFDIRPFQGLRVEGTYTQKEVEDFVARARQEGRTEGAREAERKLSEPLRAALENLENTFDEISRYRRELFKEAEEEILELVRMIATKIVRKELQLQPELLKEIVAKGIEHLEREHKVWVRLSSADQSIFKTAKEDFLESIKSLETLEISFDPQIPQGSAVLETKTVQLDLEVSAMVDHILQQIKTGKSVVTEVNEGEDA